MIPTPTAPSKPTPHRLTTEQLTRLFGTPLPDGRALIEAMADALCPGWRTQQEADDRLAARRAKNVSAWKRQAS